jgi:putative hydroxymethylpyrimidine transport system ATP-binding protein
MSPPAAVTIEGAGRLEGRPLFGPLRLDLPEGEWTCLLGPSGAGKSTILRLIAGLDTGVAFEGSVRFADGGGRRGRIGYMAQGDLLLPWLDVRGNAVLGARLRGETVARTRADDLIRRVGLVGQAGSRPAALSGGERQRAALARTLMEDRPVVLLDEPFSALDARTRAEMQELAAELLAGRTVLLVTHDPAEAARLGHRIHVLTGGGLSAVAPPPAPPVRAADAPETLAAQASLLRVLRAAA